MINKGLFHYTKREFEQSIFFFQQAKRKDSSLLEPLFLSGVSNFFLKNYDTSIDNMQNYLKEGGKKEETYLWLGNALIESKKFDEAEIYLSKSFEVEKNLNAAYYSLGFLFFMKGDFESARQSLANYLDEFPQNHEGLLLLAQIYSLEKKYRKSLEVLEKLFLSGFKKKDLIYENKSFKKLKMKRKFKRLIDKYFETL